MARRPSLNRRRLNLLHLEDRTVPALLNVLPLPPVFPPIGTPGGAIAAENDFADTDGNNPVTLDVLGNDHPATGFAIVPASVHLQSNPTRGTVSIDPANGEITYTAVGFFQGTDSFQYAVKDSSGATALANVTVVVNRPTANDDFTETAIGSSVPVNVLANDTDPDGNNQINKSSVAITAPPTHGGLSIDPATGITTYTPASGFSGTDGWRYTITDLAGATSSPAHVSVVVGPATGPALSPTAHDDVADTDGNNPVTVDVLANDLAAPGKLLVPGTVSIASGPQHGTLSLNPATGEITYSATGSFRGTDAFQYTVGDGTATSAPATVSIIVNRPTANDDFADTDGNNPVAVNVLHNDTDPDGNNEIDPASVTVVSPPSHGTLAIDPATGAITYTASGFFEGTDSFRYTITDFPGATSAPATVTIIVHRPAANPDSALAIGTTPIVIPVLANDTDPEGNDQIDPASVSIVSGPAHGTLSVDPANGSVTYTPSGNFIGYDSFQYTIEDFPGAESSPATVRIKVEALAADQFTAVGAGAGGGPAITLDNSDGSVRATFFAFESTFTGGVRVAVADVTGDGIPDIIAVPGPGGGPIVRVFDGTDLHVVANFFAYDPTFRGGLSVSAGDVNGDGTVDIITGAGNGGGPQVNVFDGATGQLLSSFFAFDSNFRGGVNVAVGDVNGDGRADIATGAGPGGGPQVNVFSGLDLSLLSSFFTFDPAFRGGVSLAVGDVDGDTIPEVIVAAGPGGGPHVLVMDGLTGEVQRSFFAYSPNFTGGVRLAAADVNQDGQADLIVAPGAGQSLPVRTLDADTFDTIHSAEAFAGFLGGVYVGGPG